MRDDGIDRDAIDQMNRCRRAARALAWWGRVAAALWLFEAVASGAPEVLSAPVWVLLFVGEAMSPGVRRGENLGPLAAFQTVALVFCVFWFWFAADGELSGDPGRTLGVTFALLLLGARSTWLIHAAWRNAPRPNPGRTPDVMKKHRRIAVAVLFSGVPWSIVLMGAGILVAGWESGSLGSKVLVLGVLILVAAVPLSRQVVRGAGVGFSVFVTLLVSMITLGFGPLTPYVLGSWFPVMVGLMVCHVIVLILLLSAAGGGERPPAPWEGGRADDE